MEYFRTGDPNHLKIWISIGNLIGDKKRYTLKFFIKLLLCHLLSTF
jgi:hypothetical protein